MTSRRRYRTGLSLPPQSQLLAQQPVGDGRPSQLVRRMRQLVGDDPLEGDFWKQFFIKWLRANIQLAPETYAFITGGLELMLTYVVNLASFFQNSGNGSTR